MFGHRLAVGVDAKHVVALPAAADHLGLEPADCLVEGVPRFAPGLVALVQFLVPRERPAARTMAPIMGRIRA